jgi:hypothetical protein
MPCWIYLRGDAEAITSEEPADVVLHRIEQAEADAFVHFGLSRLAPDDEVRTGYVRARDVVAVLPMHPRQVAADLDDPPEWYRG